MEYLDKFIEEKCVVSPEHKILSSKLYETFKDYLRIKNINQWNLLTNMSFTIAFKKNYPQYIHKRYSNGYHFQGLTLLSEYVSTEKRKKPLNHDQTRKNKSLTNQKYYQNNVEKLKTRNQIKYSNDQLLREKLNISYEQFLNRRRNGLIGYKLNLDNSVNWDETITHCQKLVDDFKNNNSQFKLTINNLHSLINEPVIDLNNITKDDLIKYTDWYQQEHDRLEDIRISCTDQDKLKEIENLSLLLLNKFDIVESAYNDKYYID